MRSWLAIMVLLAVSLAGCGDKESADAFVTPEKDDKGRYVIMLTNEKRFEPAKAKVPAGAVVVWKVEGGSHTVEARDGSFDSTQGFNSAFMTSGDEYSWLAENEGDYEYFCDPHESQGMVGTLRVT